METQEKTPKSMTNEELIGACVTLDREQKKSRAMLNGYKAELQARGLADRSQAWRYRRQEVSMLHRMKKADLRSHSL